MSENQHERARRLIDTERIEGIGREDRTWLEAHLAACADCDRWAARGEEALRALINTPVPLPSNLAAITAGLVRREAELRKARRVRNLALIGGCALSWLLGVASAPLVWRVCAWVGSELDLPRAVWMLGFAAWWLVPASAAAALVLWQRERIDRERADGAMERHGRREN